jgi:putative Mg2+ transporter-C (MgtC) family protein
MMLNLANWISLFTDPGHLLLAFVLNVPIGWNREQEEHNMGIRTFPIIGAASCAFIMIGGIGGDTAAQSRVLQGLVAGIGFLGGGVILKEGKSVIGTATAASVLGAAAIGAAVALNRFSIAICLTLLNLAALRVLLPLKQRLDR